MKINFDPSLHLQREGFGNIDYQVPGGNANALDAAADGLSIEAASPDTVRLGQTVGQAGDPAALTEDREIPDAGGFTVFFGKNDGVSNVVGINADAGIDISNNNGTGILYFDGNKNFAVNMPDADTIELIFGPANTLIYSVSKKEWAFNGEVQVTGFGANVRKPGAVAVINVVKNDYTILIDTSAGNVVVNIDPAIVGNQVLNFKKTTSDANTITLTPVTGTIQGFGAPAATYAFNLQGESVTLHNDGTNFFII